MIPAFAAILPQPKFPQAASIQSSVNSRNPESFSIRKSGFSFIRNLYDCLLKMVQDWKVVKQATAFAEISVLVGFCIPSAGTELSDFHADDRHRNNFFLTDCSAIADDRLMPCDRLPESGTACRISILEPDINCKSKSPAAAIAPLERYEDYYDRHFFDVIAENVG